MKRIALIALSFLLGAFLLFSFACEYPAPIKVVNQTDRALIIYVYYANIDVEREIGIKIGEIKPGETAKNTRLADTVLTYRVTATDERGKIVYSEDIPKDYFKLNEWTVIITEDDLL
jgi:hypothetical protein